MHFDLDYLRRVANRTDPAAILQEPTFLKAQQLFLSTIASMGGSVDFDVADLHEIHAIAALKDQVAGKKVLDLGCGSPEAYVLEDTFRDRYPPFVAEMLTTLGADVTGVDIRPNDTATYDHRVLDLAQPDWTTTLEPPYDIVLCFSLFNAPESPFEYDNALCEHVLEDVHALLAPGGLLVANLREGLTEKAASLFEVVHTDGNCAWLQRN